MKIRFANESDTALILRFIKELADYEGLLHRVTGRRADERLDCVQAIG